jgi:Xaa-Pro aminopeptidase
VEPGIYIARNAPVEARWRGIGIRIEDDVAVTPRGFRHLTADIPREPAELERILGSRSRSTSPG